MKVDRILFGIACLTLCIMLSLAIPNESPAPPANKWAPNYAFALGFQPDTELKRGDKVTSITGMIINSTKLSSIGLPANIGDQLKLLSLGNNEWKLTNMTNGKSLNKKKKKDRIKVKK